MKNELKKTTKYALLDYDGFICKAWYAALARGDWDDAWNVLQDLKAAAIDKARVYFKCEDVNVYCVTSGHSWKKDLYKSYKANRERDEFLGAFRDEVQENDTCILKAHMMEADELIVMIVDTLELHDKSEDCIVFSDDKDLHYVSKNWCKINITEEVQKTEDNKDFLQQLLMGDRIDGISGIPKVGKATAKKILDQKVYDIESVIRAYRDKEVTRELCVENLILLIPMSYEYNEQKVLYEQLTLKILKDNCDFKTSISIIIQGLIDYVTKLVEKIYSENEDN